MTDIVPLCVCPQVEEQTACMARDAYYCGCWPIRRALRVSFLHAYVLFLGEAGAHAFRVLQELLCAVGHTLGLLAGKRTRRKVVNATLEAALNKARVQTHKVLHLLLLDDLLHLHLFCRRKS